MSSSRDSYQRNPLRKVFRVLNWMADALPEGVALGETAQALGMAPSTMHRLLHQLEQEGLARQDSGTGRFHLTGEVFRFAQRVSIRFPLAGIALPIMRGLVEICGETADLNTYDPARMQMMRVVTVESPHPIRLAVEPSRWTPIYAGAAGQSTMAFLSEQERREIVARTKLVPFTERTITDPQLLEQELALIRHRGYAFSRGQRIPGAVGIAAPIWGPGGRVVGNLDLTIPEQRFDAEKVSELGRLVVEHAAQISSQMGGHPPTIESPESVLLARKEAGKESRAISGIR